MGRNAKPVELLVLEGTSRKSKAELERRKNAEIKLESRTLQADPMVRGDKRALREFRRMKKLYEEIEFVGSLDEHLINQYCLSVSELDDLVALMNDMRDAIQAVREDGELSSADRARAVKELAELLMKYDAEVRYKRAEIVKMGDRLYLNPVARSKNVPKRPAKQDDPDVDLFG